ncbi:hypothetical protein N7448_003254 [Penicillium atrosanguineum]|uniref:Uncharacterized protein n=1 Tax=Penicillium atrosanguineum TaxID=1132637 RepID=A0A9W9PVJ5_9EURO|nr:uncharacterized protein N7443_002226 [Penicillium atrosanguineum]KAJ5139846.1 hypothetical protein N7448_003254 [Penicillium atrosanguineum]KAJ5309765.1 hypothetical protein N7443_002226 [Penicillium atrosanguineum]KAJ5315286.1 hypothetical protein N7476_005593 [Penicillium atrosanguineum]
MESEKPYVYRPQGQHTHTFIMSPGREGTGGSEFCEQLFWSVTSQMKSLPETFLIPAGNDLGLIFVP